MTNTSDNTFAQHFRNRTNRSVKAKEPFFLFTYCAQEDLSYVILYKYQRILVVCPSSLINVVLLINKLKLLQTARGADMRAESISIR